jgi:chemotaxis protein CheX
MIQTEFYNAFIVAAGEILESEVGIRAARGPLSLQRDVYVTEQVTVLVSVIGEVGGMTFYGMSFDTAKAMLSKMIGQEIDSFDELAQSGIGELGNVITGRATTKLAELNVEAQISVPTLIVGQGTHISTLDIDRLIVPLDTELGAMRLDMALRYNAPKPGPSENSGWPLRVMMPPD